MSIRQLLIAGGPTSPPFSLHKIALEEHFIDPSLAHPFYGDSFSAEFNQVRQLERDPGSSAPDGGCPP